MSIVISNHYLYKNNSVPMSEHIQFIEGNNLNKEIGTRR